MHQVIKMLWSIAVVLCFVGTAFTFIYLGSVLDPDEHRALKLLFYMFAIIILLLGINTTRLIVTNQITSIIDALNTFYIVYVPILIFLLGYLFIYLIYRIFNPMIEEVKR